MSTMCLSLIRLRNIFYNLEKIGGCFPFTIKVTMMFKMVVLNHYILKFRRLLIVLILHFNAHFPLSFASDNLATDVTSGADTHSWRIHCESRRPLEHQTLSPSPHHKLHCHGCYEGPFTNDVCIVFSILDLATFKQHTFALLEKNSTLDIICE